MSYDGTYIPPENSRQRRKREAEAHNAARRQRIQEETDRIRALRATNEQARAEGRPTMRLTTPVLLASLLAAGVRAR